MSQINPIDAGMAFMLSQKDEDGFWREFGQLRHGPSTAWASAYIGRLLLPILKARGQAQVLDSTLGAIISSQNQDGGFSYNEYVPSDADSTANVLLLAQALGITIEGAERALLGHQQPDNGFSTYTPGHFASIHPDMIAVLQCEECLTDYCSGNSCPLFPGRGWCSSHVCVTAVAAQALTDRQAKAGVLKFLTAKQLSSGLWPAYWWIGQNYSTLQAIKALGKDRMPNLETLVAGLKRSGVQNIFSVALAIEGLLLLGTRPPDQFGDWLIRNQCPDGGWPSSPVLRIPRPDMENPEEANEVLFDQHRLFSTVQAVHSLYLSGR